MFAYYSPYQIIKRIGVVAYSGSSMHPIFHVSLLKKKVGDAVVV
jgi:hypothetical protein